MKLINYAGVLTLGMVVLGPPSLNAQTPPAPRVAVPVIPACSLMSKDEVKRHLPWQPILDQFPAEEEAMGNYGSACEYPSVRVQVMILFAGSEGAIFHHSTPSTQPGPNPPGETQHHLLQNRSRPYWAISSSTHRSAGS